MTVTADITVDARDAEAVLLRLNTALSSEALAEFLSSEAAPWLSERARQRFASEGDDVSGKWAPLLPATQNIRAWGAESQGWQVGPEHPINVRTGELEDYITNSFGYTVPWGQGASLVFPIDKVVTGELKAKLQTAQKGRTSPGTVARPVLGVNERDLEFILSRLVFHVEGFVR